MRFITQAPILNHSNPKSVAPERQCVASAPMPLVAVALARELKPEIAQILHCGGRDRIDDNCSVEL